MNKWQAIVAVVESFNEQNKPWLALTALFVFLIPMMTIIGAVVSLLR